MKKAFTIMEVLVTIAIVGVIGATIMGNIISTKPDPKIMAFRMAYYGLQQAVTEAVNNKYFYDQADMVNRLYNPATPSATGNAMLSSLGASQMTGLGATITGNNRATLLCRAVASYMNISGDVTCNVNNANRGNTDANVLDHANFTLLNGAVIYGLDLGGSFISPTLDDGTERNCPIPVIIDVNGADGPNTLYAAGADINNVDRYRVKISPSGKVYIGYDADEENIRDTDDAQDCNLFGLRSEANPNIFAPERAILSDPSKNKTTAQ